MLTYVDRPGIIAVVRPAENRGEKNVRLGLIRKSNFEFAPDPGVSVSDAELQEIQTLADSHKAVDDAQLHRIALKYPETTTLVMGYYAGPASELEKHLIRQTVLAAYKETRRADVREVPAVQVRVAPPPSVEPVSVSALAPTPQLLAGILYDVLAEAGRTRAKGDPRKGEKTQLKGQWDLVEIARQLLSKVAS
jgi:hypothetical protein